MSIVLAIIIFGAMILFHEFGHFLLAKMNGITVTEFAIGFGPKLLSFKKGDTVYALKLLPFGGSCAMLGDDGSEDATEGSFNSKSVGARFAVLAAGPIFNFVLAFLAALIVIGTVGYDPAKILYVEEGSPVAEAGLEEGDVITSFQGEHIDIAREVWSYMRLTGIEPGETVELTYERDGEEHSVRYIPETIHAYRMGFSGANYQGKIRIADIQDGMPMSETNVKSGDFLTSIDGVYFDSYEDWIIYTEEHPFNGDPVTITYERDGLEYEATVTPEETSYASLGFDYNMGREKTTPIGVLKYALAEIKYCIKVTIKSLGLIITGRFGVEDMSGPVGVVNIIGETYEAVQPDGAFMVFINMLNLIILLSANLGVMNLLPIPALDGGRLVFIIIEAIRGKPISQEKESMVHFAGMMFMMVLMVVVLFNDIQKIL